MAWVHTEHERPQVGSGTHLISRASLYLRPVTLDIAAMWSICFLRHRREPGLIQPAPQTLHQSTLLLMPGCAALHLGLVCLSISLPVSLPACVSCTLAAVCAECAKLVNLSPVWLYLCGCCLPVSIKNLAAKPHVRLRARYIHVRHCP